MKPKVLTSVADPHHCNTDPDLDLAFHFDAEPNANLQPLTTVCSSF
jgi:hypothetical protein